jgi:hypothetical protein
MHPRYSVWPASSGSAGPSRVQQYIYRTLLGNIRARGFDIVDEEFKDDQTIRLKVRHWEN